MPLPKPERPFDEVAAELATDQFTANPTFASSLGLTEYDELLPDLSGAAMAARARNEDEWLQRLGELADADLDAEERLDRDLVTMVLRGRVVMRDWADWKRSPDHYSSTALGGVFVLLLNRIRPEPELAAAVAARLRATPALLEQGRDNLDPELAHPVLVRRALGQVKAGAIYARAVAAEIGDEGERAQVVEAGEPAAAAFESFGAHLEKLAEVATGEWSIGEQRYDALLRDAEGLGYGARGLRERGQRAYDEIVDDMRRRTRELRGHEDWRRLLTELSHDRPQTPEEMLELYREATAAARQFCLDHELVTFPPGERCDVVPSAPFSRGMIAVAHYAVPPPFAPGNHAGHFFVPYPPEGATPEQVAARLETNNRHGLWSIAVHEAYPGHHWHFAWMAANRPRPLRAVFGSAYFSEGWGLYVEELLREKGFFRTPEQELCQRDFRLFRAARMVVDTSLHLGEMTIDDAGEFMSTKASLSRETAQAEVLRYCAWPTQAASYLTGALELDRLRARWLSEDRGSLRDFHDSATRSGRLPISLVEKALFP